MNAISIGVSTEVHPTWVGWYVVDIVFAFLFLGEMLVRMFIVGPRSCVLCGDGERVVYVSSRGKGGSSGEM